MNLLPFNERQLSDIFNLSLKNLELWSASSEKVLNQDNDKMPIRFNKKGEFKVKFLTLEQIHFFTGKSKSEIISAFTHFDAYSAEHVEIKEKNTSGEERINHVTALAYSQKWGKPGVRFSANTWSYNFCLVVAEEFKWELPSLREWHIKKVLKDSLLFLKKSETIDRYAYFANHLQELSYKIRFHSLEDRLLILNGILNEPEIHKKINVLLNQKPWKDKPLSVHHNVLDSLENILLEQHLKQNVKMPTPQNKSNLTPIHRF